MADIVYNWNFSPLEIVYNKDELIDVIDLVHWQYSATYNPGESDSISRQNMGTVSLETPHSASFIPFAEVTKDMVTEWVVNSLGINTITDIQNSLSSSIAYELHPTKGLVAPPWENPNPPTPEN